MEHCIELKNITKKYKIYDSKAQRLFDIVTKKNKANLFTALNNINISVKKGDIVGIMGVNGSGKSTLLKIISGVTYATEGQMKIDGRVSSLLELSAGFDENSTGIENIYLKGLLIGMDKKEINKIVNDIIEFAAIGDYIHQPVRMYSSGMKARLGFSISIHVQPDILIVDEALSVGDEAFRIKCYNAINDIKEEGATILFVSHSLSQLKTFCNKGIWLNTGEIKAVGDIGEVIFKYRQFLKTLNNNEEENENFESKTKNKKENHKIVTLDHIFKRLGASMRNKNNEKTYTFGIKDEIKINCTYEISKPMKYIKVKFKITDDNNNLIYENNLSDEQYNLSGESGTYDLRITLNNSSLLPGAYFVDMLLFDESLLNKIYIIKKQGIEIKYEQKNDKGEGMVLLEHQLYTKKRV
ncbi:ABC transporter ATP-binding protein [Haloplasma contractile]|uniref:Teichoic acids export ATP-binding protein TagH n=1 Tax=Haloplasma contractile SSD-17B TaxID=1033810 RepID=U2FDK8_9MOLU|nr:ABC transporter ATP-binding protein [Haloplasma contractile]ERJ11060.1 Teichoic acids export ATP-binding protein TagH [Haloplasma contractile SSD-17B]